jgi:hypothetical protein
LLKKNSKGDFKAVKKEISSFKAGENIKNDIGNLCINNFTDNPSNPAPLPGFAVVAPGSVA